MVKKATSLSNTKSETPQEERDEGRAANSSGGQPPEELDNQTPRPTCASDKRARKISKRPPAHGRRSTRRQRVASRSGSPEREELAEDELSESQHAQPEAARCDQHVGQKVEFMCKSRGCLEPLCAFCILEHKEHIQEIAPLREIVQENIRFFGEATVDELRGGVLFTQSRSLREFEALVEKLKALLHRHINSFKERLIREDESACLSLHNVIAFKQFFQKNDSSLTSFNPEGVSLIRECLKSKDKSLQHGYVIEEKLILEQFSKLLGNNVSFTVGGQSFNSTEVGVQKLLHWFEWEKREIHLFNITDYSYKSVKLIVPFKVPPFSRSIMLPDGKVLLLGGEDPELGAKREVYSLDLLNLESDHTLHPRSPMPFKKYDFTVCQHKNFVYVICGKDADSQVVDSCERFDVARNQWSLLAPINKRRYAASAVVLKESDRIYLFGGRSDYHNTMMEDIEEYDIVRNSWRIVKLKTPNVWTPVEVCATIQVGPGRILIFGGSEASIEDSKNSYIFNAEDFSIEKTAPLKKAHVFVAAPFMHGGSVFAVGNEYYVKSRNVHRFNIEKAEWEIVF